MNDGRRVGESTRCSSEPGERRELRMLGGRSSQCDRYLKRGQDHRLTFQTRTHFQYQSSCPRPRLRGLTRRQSCPVHTRRPGAREVGWPTESTARAPRQATTEPQGTKQLERVGLDTTEAESKVSREEGLAHDSQPRPEGRETRELASPPPVSFRLASPPGSKYRSAQPRRHSTPPDAMAEK